MNDEENNTPSEIDSLKERATTMGLSFHPSIGVEKLRDKINAELSKDSDDTKESQDTSGEDEEGGVETANQKRLRKKREASEMVRIRVTCMNPNKRDYDGDLFMAGNSVIGTFKCFVPFDVEWHVPKVIYNMIVQRKCQVFVTRKDERNRPVKEGKLIPEYSVSVLEPLTKEELGDLAQRQAMANGTASAA